MSFNVFLWNYLLLVSIILMYPAQSDTGTR